MRAYILTYTGEQIPVMPKARGEELNPQTFTLEEMQDIVGGYIQIIDLTEEVVMVMDEEGKLKEKFFNPAATEIFRKCFPKTSDFIVGNVLVCESDMIE